MLAALTLAMSLFMSSCADDEPTGPSDIVLGEMSATVGGNNWKGGNALYYNNVNQISGAEMVGGLTNLGDINTITIAINQLAGEPELKTYSAFCFYNESRLIGTSSSVKQWNDKNGTCVVTEVTAKFVRGTFTFNGVNEDDNSTKSVSGKFYTPRQ